MLLVSLFVCCNEYYAYGLSLRLAAMYLTSVMIPGRGGTKAET